MLVGTPLHLKYYMSDISFQAGGEKNSKNWPLVAEVWSNRR